MPELKDFPGHHQAEIPDSTVVNVIHSVMIPCTIRYTKQFVDLSDNNGTIHVIQ